MSLAYQVGVNESVLRFPAVQSESLPLLTALGAKWLRVDAPLLESNSWPGIAPTTATGYNATAATDIAALKTACASAGLKLLVTLVASVTASSVNGVSFSPADYGSAAAWIAGQCPGVTWELNNEPDINGISAALYTASVKAAYPAMKTADPTCKVVKGAISNVGASGGRAYMASCYADGIAGYSDITSVHTYNRFSPYPNPFNPGTQSGGGTVALTPNVVAFQALMTANDDPSPLWITEFGWDTDSSDANFATIAQQAAFTASWLTDLEVLGVPVVMIYNLSDNDPPNYGLVTNAFAPKQSYYAVQDLIAGFRLCTNDVAHYRLEA